MKTSIAVSEITVKTVKSGCDYRVVIRGRSLLFMLNAEQTHVFIRQPHGSLGGWSLDRFEGGKLTPASIRTWIHENLKGPAEQAA